MNIKRIITDKIEGITNKVDDSLLSYIDRFIKPEMKELEKAIVIYLGLGDVLCYSPEFSLTYDYDKALRSSEVNLGNNEIMCKSWSILYHRLLKQYGVFSKVLRVKGHYKVQIPLDGVIYQADATGYGAYGIHYSMSDIARIKYGFKIEKFILCTAIDPYDVNLFIEKSAELKEMISSVYKKQNRKCYSNLRIISSCERVMDRIEENKEKVGFGTEEDITYRVNIINRFWRLNIDNSPLEKVQLFNNFFKIIFGDFEEHEAKCYNLYSCLDGKVIIYKLIAIAVEADFYYYLDDGKEFKAYDSKSLIDEIWRRDIKLNSYTDILGIYSGLELCKVKSH